VSPRRPLTLERQPVPKNRLLLRVSRPRPLRLRLPRHPRVIVFSKSTTVLLQPQNLHPHDAATAGDINPSAPTFGFYSSLIVCGAPVATTGGCWTMCVCDGRHHCWLAGPLGLGFYVYICNHHLYAIQSSHSNRLCDILVFQVHMDHFETGCDYHTVPCRGLHSFVQAMKSSL
jgi:hypothetical protein